MIKEEMNKKKKKKKKKKNKKKKKKKKKKEKLIKKMSNYRGNLLFKGRIERMRKRKTERGRIL